MLLVVIATALCNVGLLANGASVDYSVHGIEKCVHSNVDAWDRTLEIPAAHMSTGLDHRFRLTDHCAKKLPGCGQCDYKTTIMLTSQVQVTPNGYLRHEKQYYGPDSVCLVRKHPNVTFKACDRSDAVLVPKCCSINKVLDIETNACENSGAVWYPPVYEFSDNRACVRRSPRFKYHYSPPMCEDFQIYFTHNVMSHTRVRFRVLTNGTVLLQDVGSVEWVSLDVGSFCLDGVSGSEHSALIVCQQGVKVVSARGIDTQLRWTGILYIILLFSGVPFLAVTVVIYTLVLGQQNVHGWVVFSHTLAMLIHYLAMGLANTLSRVFYHDDGMSVRFKICYFIGILNHFTVLSSFCWLTVINYDLFSMFRHLKSPVNRNRGLKRFSVYMCGAWGIPLVVVVASVVLDSLYGIYGEDVACGSGVVVPLYGYKTCYMAEEALPYYLHYPVGVLMGVNLGLAAVTIWNMLKHSKDTQVAAHHQQTHKFWVLTKLLLVMGVVWVFEVVVFIGFNKKGEDTLPWYLVFPDLFNLVQAAAIFFLFACRDKILKQVGDAFPRLLPFTRCLGKLQWRNV